MQTHSQKHCINVVEVIDWMVKPVHMKMRKTINSNKIVTDHICGNIELTCGENALLWKSIGPLSVSGCVTICHQAGCEQMEVLLNGRSKFIVSKEEETTINVDNLKSIEVKCNGNKKEICFGTYDLTLYYKWKELNLQAKSSPFVCYLSDEDGNPTHSIVCQEIPEDKSRPDVKVKLPNGKTIVQQLVKILNKGYVTVQLLQHDKLCQKLIIPFLTVEKLVLCAPKDTFIDCRARDFQCTSYIANNCDIKIAISLCLEVKVIANQTIEVEARYYLPHFDKEPLLIPQ